MSKQNASKIPLPDPQMWHHIIGLMARGETAKNKQEDLRRLRKALEEQLNQKGTKKKDSEYLGLTGEFYDCIKRLEAATATIKENHDALLDAIKKASEGFKIGVDAYVQSVMDQLGGDKPEASPLFDKAAQAKVGEPQNEVDAEEPAAAPFDPDPRLRIPLIELPGVIGSNGHLAALKNVGIETLDEVRKHVSLNGEGSLRALLGEEPDSDKDRRHSTASRLLEAIETRSKPENPKALKPKKRTKK